MQAVKVKIVNKSTNPLPAYETIGSAGMDLRAFLDRDIQIKPLERILVPTGLYISLPEGYEAQVRPRSGWAVKYGISVLNSPGTIDADYRGQIQVILVNLSQEPFTLKNGDRMAQMVISKHESINWQQVDELDETKRGSGGFGHTGKN